MTAIVCVKCGAKWFPDCGWTFVCTECKWAQLVAETPEAPKGIVIKSTPRKPDTQ